MINRTQFQSSLSHSFQMLVDCATLLVQSTFPLFCMRKTCCFLRTHFVFVLCALAIINTARVRNRIIAKAIEFKSLRKSYSYSHNLTNKNNIFHSFGVIRHSTSTVFIVCLEFRPSWTKKNTLLTYATNFNVQTSERLWFHSIIKR